MMISDETKTRELVEQDLGGVEVQHGVVQVGVVHREGVCVLARVKDGFGGEKSKRSYWRKSSGVPDGLVQKRIFEFSKSKCSGGGGISAISSPGRKRKYLEK